MLLNDPIRNRIVNLLYSGDRDARERALQEFSTLDEYSKLKVLEEILERFPKRT